MKSDLEGENLADNLCNMWMKQSYGKWKLNDGLHKEQEIKTLGSREDFTLGQRSFPV